jgi:hypothetical protein
MRCRATLGLIIAASSMLSTCMVSSVAVAPPCGKGVIEAGEECEGINVQGNNCTTIGRGGFAGGKLGCNAFTCRFDTSLCSSPADPITAQRDLNGDAYADIVIGSDGPVEYRSARVFLGGPGTTLDVTVDGTMGGAGTGWIATSPALLGDVNGDGFADIALHAETANGEWIYVFLGGAGGDFDSTVDAVLGLPAPDEVPAAVAPAGDVNGDGYADLVVAAHRPLGGPAPPYVFLGSSDLDSSADGALDAPANGLAAPRWAGDLNGDGYGDLVAGAVGACPETECVAAYVYLGGPAPSFDGSPDGALVAERFSDNPIVSAAGDVDADGFDDLMVADDGYGGATGRAYLFRGGAGNEFDPVADAVLTSLASLAWFGGALAGGDVNGDGMSDVFVGEYAAGRVDVYMGRPDLPWGPVPDATIQDPSTGFGLALLFAGDLNGDGYGDVVLGGGWSSEVPGQAFVFLGGSGTTLEPTVDAVLMGENDGDRFGTYLAVSTRRGP